MNFSNQDLESTKHNLVFRKREKRITISSRKTSFITHSTGTKVRANPGRCWALSLPTWLSPTFSTSHGWAPDFGPQRKIHKRAPGHNREVVCQEILNRVWSIFSHLSLSSLALALLLKLEQSVAMDILTLSMVCFLFIKPSSLVYSSWTIQLVKNSHTLTNKKNTDCECKISPLRHVFTCTGRHDS